MIYMVKTIEDMLSMNNEKYKIHNGMTVFVENDSTAYCLNDINNISNINGWDKIRQKHKLTSIKRLRKLLKNALIILRNDNCIFEIIEDIGITKEEYDELLGGE